MNVYIQQYQNSQIQTASPEKILIMLYDGAIRFVRQAIAGIQNNTPSQKNEGIRRCVAIIAEFANTLDHEVGGEIAADLNSLYEFMQRELTKANAQNDIQPLMTVDDLLVGLRETWLEAIEINRQETATVRNESHFSQNEQNISVSP